MTEAVRILMAEDDLGHATLIRKNLKRAGITNEVIHFPDGEAVLDFLFGTGTGPHRSPDIAYLLLLDIRMPKADGVEVLARIKADPLLRKMPVIMLTTTDDPKEIEHCHELGCSSYITKPIVYETFLEVIRNLGLFLTIVQVPTISSPKTPAK